MLISVYIVGTYTSLMKERDNKIIIYWINKNNINIQNFQIFYYIPDVISESYMANIDKGLTPEILKEQLKKK